MINMQPEKMPAEAAPAIALPMMKIMELGAAPQIAEPISKTTTLVRKTLGESERCQLAEPSLLRMLTRESFRVGFTGETGCDMRNGDAPFHVVKLVYAAIDELGTSSG